MQLVETRRRHFPLTEFADRDASRERTLPSKRTGWSCALTCKCVGRVPPTRRSRTSLAAGEWFVEFACVELTDVADRSISEREIE